MCNKQESRTHQTSSVAGSERLWSYFPSAVPPRQSVRLLSVAILSSSCSCQQLLPPPPPHFSVCLCSPGQEPFKRRPFFKQLHLHAARWWHAAAWIRSITPNEICTEPISTTELCHQKTQNCIRFSSNSIGIFQKSQLRLNIWWLRLTCEGNCDVSCLGRMTGLFADVHVSDECVFLFLLHQSLTPLLFLAFVRANTGQRRTKQAGVTELYRGGRLRHAGRHRLGQEHRPHQGLERLCFFKMRFWCRSEILQRDCSLNSRVAFARPLRREMRQASRICVPGEGAST